MSDLVWLIEKYDGTGSHKYWEGRDDYFFSSDPMMAIRFSRQQDAVKAMHYLLSDKGRAFCRVAEHKFIKAV